MRSAQDRLEPATEGDRLSLVIRAAVSQQLVQLVDRKHREISSHRLGGSGCPLRTARGIRKDLQAHPGTQRWITEGDAVVESSIDTENERLTLGKMRNQAEN